jgi:vitamin B12 transporter
VFLQNAAGDHPLKPSLPLSFLIILNPSPSHAEEPPPELPEIIVTATRTAQTTDESLASVTVITRQDIEHSQALTLPEILRGTLGLDIVSSGGLGKATSVFMRGTESDHILVLIDGIKISSATLGTAPLQHLPLAQIERIEIVRGPRSSVYGSEAIGGVIQIFTRKGQGTQASAGVGSDGSYTVTTSTSGGSKAWYSIHVSHLHTQGFDDCQGNLNGGCFTIEPDKDSYHNTAMSARLGYSIENKAHIEAQILHDQGNTEYDSTFDNEADFAQQVLNLKTDIDINPRWRTTINVGDYRDKLDNNSKQNLLSTYFDTHRTMLSWQNNLVLMDDHSLIIGYDDHNEDVDSSVAYQMNSRDNQGLFTQYQTQLKNVDVIVGLRLDDNEQFGHYRTGHVSLGYTLTPALRLITSYGTAFKAPTFNELYFPSLGGFPAFGNPTLRPEESQSIEVGLTGTQAHYAWTTSLYHTRIEQLIGGLPAENIDNATIVGLEGSFTWHHSRWEGGSQFSWLRPEDDATDLLLPRRAQKTLQAHITYHLGQLRLGMNSILQSHRFEDKNNVRRLGGYTVVDLTGEYQLNRHWKIATRIGNVLNREYHTVDFYNNAGRIVFINLDYQF